MHWKNLSRRSRKADRAVDRKKTSGELNSNTDVIGANKKRINVSHATLASKLSHPEFKSENYHGRKEMASTSNRNEHNLILLNITFTKRNEVTSGSSICFSLLCRI